MEPRPHLLFLERAFSTSSMMCSGIFLSAVSDRPKRVRQDFNITEDVWNTRRSLIRADHRLPNAREELERLWKERIDKDLAALSGAAGAGVVDPADSLPLEDE